MKQSLKLFITRFAIIAAFIVIPLGIGGVAQAIPCTGQGCSLLGNIVHGNASQWHGYINGFGVDSYGEVIKPGTLVQRIAFIFFSMLGLIAVVLMIYAGFLWLTAGGEENKAKQGTTLMFQAVVGLIIILAAYSVTYFVIVMLTSAISA